MSPLSRSDFTWRRVPLHRSFSPEEGERAEMARAQGEGEEGTEMGEQRREIGWWDWRDDDDAVAPRSWVSSPGAKGKGRENVPVEQSEGWEVTRKVRPFPYYILYLAKVLSDLLMSFSLSPRVCVWCRAWRGRWRVRWTLRWT